MTLPPHILFMSCPVTAPEVRGSENHRRTECNLLVIAGLPVGHSHMQVCKARVAVTQVHKGSWQKATCTQHHPPHTHTPRLQKKICSWEHLPDKALLRRLLRAHL